MAATTLNQIIRHKTVTIQEIKESPWSTRLAELGFLPGSKASVIRKSPVGSTLYVKLNSTRIALRKNEAEQVVIIKNI